MTARREIRERLRSLDEIRQVMNSMKTLAYMETRKLARFLRVQQRQVDDIETMAADLLDHFPQIRPPAAPAKNGLVLIGAERGFCADFNGKVLQAGRRIATPETSALIAVGQRLGAPLEGGDTPRTVLTGASASEQVPSVLDALARSVAAAQQTHGLLDMTVVYHDSDGGLRERTLFPPFAGKSAPRKRHGHPPRLNLAPSLLFPMLLHQYLFAVLSGILYSSLMAENQRRVQHLDSAVHHLDERVEALARRDRVLRQEEIIEEIEVILLSARATGAVAAGR